MANWAYVEAKVLLPTKNIDKFFKYFGYCYTEGKNIDTKMYLARTNLLSGSEEEEMSDDKKFISVRFTCEVAWSIESSWISGYPADEDNFNCVTINQILKECEVVKFRARSEEPGVGFEELLTYEIGGDVIMESRDYWYTDFSTDFEEAYEMLKEYRKSKPTRKPKESVKTDA